MNGLRICLRFKPTIGVAALAAVSLIVMSCCPILGNKWYHATYKNGVEFAGAKGKNGQVEYFSIRVGNDQAQALPVECELEFRWNGQKYLIRELGLNDLARMGISPQPKAGNPDGSLMAFIGGKDSNNRDYGAEFHFRDGRIYHFYAWHSSRSAVACPFKLSITNQNPVSFPFGDRQLRESFGVPDSVVAIPGT